MILDPDIMKQDMTIGQDLTDSNLLVEEENNWAHVIDREHNQDPYTIHPSDALAANVIVAIRIRRH